MSNHTGREVERDRGGQIIVKVGQVWRRKRDEKTVRVYKRMSEPIHDDWRVRDVDGPPKAGGYSIFGWNLNRLYDLVQDAPQDENTSKEN